MHLTPTLTHSEQRQPVDERDLFLIDALLDANRISNGWQKFLDAFRDHFQLHSCHIYISSVNDMAPRFQDFSGPQPSDWQLKEYMEKYFHTDYTHLAILRGTPGNWYASNLLPNRAEVEAAPVYNEWCVPNGIICVAGCCLFRNENSVCVFVHNRGPEHQEYSHEEIRRFSALTSYLMKAVQLRIKLAEGNHDRLRIKSILNKFRLPVASLNEFGEVIAQNDLMRQLLQSHHNLRISHDKELQLSHQDKDKQFKMAIAERIASAKGRSLSYQAETLLIPAEGHIPEYRLGIDQIVEDSDDGDSVFVGALVYAVSPEMLIAPSERQLIHLFNLTPAEARCCHLFASGVSLKEIAEQENKSINTAREQLQNCYRKTNSKNQLELINLLAGLPAG